MIPNFLYWLTICSIFTEIPLVYAASSTTTEGGSYFSTGVTEIRCEEFWVIRDASVSANEIAARFQLSTNDLALLNPYLFVTPLNIGTPVCVAGAAKVDEGQGEISMAIGKRNSESYVITPSMQINCTSIIDNQSNLDILTFLELNPTLDCAQLATTNTTIYLPPGISSLHQTNESMQPIAEVDHDCIVGPWGEWTDCGPLAEQARYRNIYQPAAGIGSPCPNTYESRLCNATITYTESLSPCPTGYDGCSVPMDWLYYDLFTPACNCHDICYVCNTHSGWEVASKSYCDDMFKSKMVTLCNSYWAGKVFDLNYCLLAADAYRAAVSTTWLSKSCRGGGHCTIGEEGCFWKPWDNELNNAGPNMGFVPEWAGCPCYGRSCRYM
mmetsp:Transcript_24345/g.34888  ORF Transcript_24345/g.34888 Transcript_24345/m.34888 type:complete len:383 (+) Transcript_24345:66-1214(+)